MDFFNTCSNVLAAIHVDCTFAGCSSSHEATCIRSRKSLTGALRLPASKASLVTSSRCEQRLNGASCRREKTPETTLVWRLKWRWLQPQKWHFQWLCKRCLNGAGMTHEMALVVASKLHFQWYCKWCLNGAGIALEIALVVAPKMHF